MTQDSTHASSERPISQFIVSVQPFTLAIMIVIAAVAGCTRSPNADCDLPGVEGQVAFDTEPELVSMKTPTYPENARAKGVEGIVHVRVIVGEDGLVKCVSIDKSVPLLDKSAAAAARTAVFKPGLLDQKPVAVMMVIPIEFAL